MYIFMGLIWHQFSPLPEKRSVFNLHNPRLACSPRSETYRESRAKVGGFTPSAESRLRGVRVAALGPAHVQQDCVRARERIEISHRIPDLYGSCARQPEWEGGSRTRQMLCVY